jgi:hypothetical protein
MDIDHGKFDSFWSLCDERSTLLAEKLKRNEEFAFYTELDEMMAQAREGRYDDSNLNFCVSNIGVMGNTSSDVVKINEHYFRMTCETGRLASNPFVAITSIDGNLCIGYSYNENMVSTPVIEQMVVEVNHLIEVIS